MLHIKCSLRYLNNFIPSANYSDDGLICILYTSILYSVLLSVVTIVSIA